MAPALDVSHPESLWAATAPPPPDAPPLAGAVRADVAVVGGGFTGLSAALHLAEGGADVVVLEGAEIGFGGSGRNAGLVNAGLWLAPEEVERLMGREAGARLNEVLGNSPDLVFSLIERHGIECEAVRNGTLHLAHSPAAVAELETRCAQWAARDAPVSMIDRAKTIEMTGTEYYHGALYDQRSGTIQPMGYVRGLAHAAVNAGARLHCRSPARGLEQTGAGWRVTTPSGSVEASSVILATNAYTDKLWPGLKETIYPIYYFQFATRPLGDNVLKTILPERQGTWDTRKVIYAFRLDAAGRLILGSIGNMPEGGSAFFRRWADRVLGRLYPQLGSQAWEHGWTGRIAFTPDHLPRIHRPAPGLVTSIGYNGRGIGPGTVFGKALAEYLLGRPEGELPLPLTTPAPMSMPGLRGMASEAATRAYHTGDLFL